MKGFLATVFATVLVSTAVLNFSTTTAQPVDKKAREEQTKALLTQCKTTVGATDADLQALLDHKVPKTKTGQCLLECVFDATKLMTNGKYSKSGFIEGFKPLIGDDEAKMKGVEQLASTCESEIGQGGQDKCQTAKLLVDCIVKNGRAYGLNIPTGRK